MSFDWLSFVRSRNIHYVTSGPNVARDHIAIRCPFCGADDPSEHMGLSLKGEGWACWRRKDHRGRNPTRLIVALIGCSYETAATIAGVSTLLPDDFMGSINAALNPPARASRGKPLRLPEEFKHFGTGMPSQTLFTDYLKRRGLLTEEIKDLTADFGMFYCARGPYKGRVIFPIHFHRELVTWTGRSVYPSVDLRYKTLAVEHEKAAFDGHLPAVGPITDYLLWYDEMPEQGRAIILCEGPFDALKLRVLGRRYGIYATCFFTHSPTAAQVELLHDLLPRFSLRYLLLDRGTLPNALLVQATLSGLGVRILGLPENAKDPGELNELRGLNIDLDLKRDRA